MKCWVCHEVVKEEKEEEEDDDEEEEGEEEEDKNRFKTFKSFKIINFIYQLFFSQNQKCISSTKQPRKKRKKNTNT